MQGYGYDFWGSRAGLLDRILLSRLAFCLVACVAAGRLCFWCTTVRMRWLCRGAELAEFWRSSEVVS